MSRSMIVILQRRLCATEVSQKWQRWSAYQGGAYFFGSIAGLPTCNGLFSVSIMFPILWDDLTNLASSWTSSFICSTFTSWPCKPRRSKFYLVTRDYCSGHRDTKYRRGMEQTPAIRQILLCAIHQTWVHETLEHNFSFQIPERWVCTIDETHHLIFQLRGQILTSLCVPCSFVDAFHEGTYDEHSVFHVSQHREDGAFSTKEEPSTSA